MSTFRIHEFAKLAGVTVRALHHYDRLGLLSPSHRSDRGYRLYERGDLGRLERILVLRYLGLSLREIASLLQHDCGDSEPLLVTLARQRAVLRDRRMGIDGVLRAVEHVQARAANAAEPDWLLYQIILKEIHMQETQNWTEKYFSPSAFEALRERGASKPKQMAEIGAKWRTLFGDIMSALDRGVPPDSAEGRALVARWTCLSDELGNPEIGQGFRRLYEDESQWPDDEQAVRLRANMPNAEVRSFFHRAVQACLRHG